MERKQFLSHFGIQNATLTSIIQSGKRRLYINYEDGTERIDEFDQKTHELHIRKWKKKSSIKETKWEYEVGEEPNPNLDNQMIIKSNKNPIFIRKDLLNEFQFRIRNLKYEASVFQLSVEDNMIVVRTTIKKYFKKINIPDLDRVNIPLEQNNLKWTFQNNTLIISYLKPAKYMELQKIMMMEFTRMNQKNPKDGDLECNVQ